MSKTIKIPECMHPAFEVIVNGIPYKYPAGETVEVPDAVAVAIEAHIKHHTQEPPEPSGGGNSSGLTQPEWGEGKTAQVSKELKYGPYNGWSDYAYNFCFMTSDEYQGMMESTDFVGKAILYDPDNELTTTLDVTKEQFAYNEEKQILTGPGVPWVAPDCGDYATISYSYKPVVKIPAKYVEQDTSAVDAVKVYAELAYEAMAIELNPTGETHELGGYTFTKVSNEVVNSVAHKKGALTLWSNVESATLGKSQRMGYAGEGIYVLCGEMDYCGVDEGEASLTTSPTVICVTDTSSNDFPSTGIWMWEEGIGEVNSPITVRPYATSEWRPTGICVHCLSQKTGGPIGELGASYELCCSDCGG